MTLFLSNYASFLPVNEVRITDKLISGLRRFEFSGRSILSVDSAIPMLRFFRTIRKKFIEQDHVRNTCFTYRGKPVGGDLWFGLEFVEFESGSVIRNAAPPSSDSVSSSLPL